MGSVYSIVSGVILVGLVILGVVMIVASRRNEGQHHQDGDSLWEELRRAHGLSRGEARRLREAAEQASLAPASLIFLEPHVLKQAMDARAAEAQPGDPSRDLTSRLYS